MKSYQKKSGYETREKYLKTSLKFRIFYVIVWLDIYD